MNIIRLSKHIKRVGWKQFREDFKLEKARNQFDPKIALRLQTQGLMGMILFNLINIGVFIYLGFWTISGIFLFSTLVTIGQLMSARQQLKVFVDMEKAMKEEVAQVNRYIS